MTRLLSLANWWFIAAAVAMPLSAQAAACQGRVFIEAIYSNLYQSGKMGIVDGNYFVLVVNRSNKPITMDLVFSNMPQNVTLFSPTFPRITLQPNSSQTIKFGMGNNANINTSTVRVAYDSAPAGQASATLRNCQ